MGSTSTDYTSFLDQLAMAARSLDIIATSLEVGHE